MIKTAGLNDFPGPKNVANPTLSPNPTNKSNPHLAVACLGEIIAQTEVRQRRIWSKITRYTYIIWRYVKLWKLNIEEISGKF